MRPVLMLMFISLSFFSCRTYQKVVYFQGIDNNDFIPVAVNEPVIKSGDILSVLVFARDMESAKDFNFPDENLNTVNREAGYLSGIPTNGYVVNTEGFVTLPIIGLHQLAGMTLFQASEYLKSIYDSFLLEPFVVVDIKNFKVTLLGEVNAPGLYQVPNHKMSLLELFGLAGDLKITANRRNIIVVREGDGGMKVARINLTDQSIFLSEYFYLAQNDIIYVEPNFNTRIKSSFISSNILGLFFSTIGVTLSIIAFSTR